MIALAALATGLVILAIFLLPGDRSLRRQTSVPPQSSTPAIAGAISTAILTEPMSLSGNKSIASQQWNIEPSLFETRNMIKLTYNLHGLCLLGGKSSEIAIIAGDPPHPSTISLKQYGKECFDGTQDIDIPLAHFPSLPQLDTTSDPIVLRISLWYPTLYEVDIERIIVYNSGGAVLGATTTRSDEVRHKTFPSVTPIRAEPYARTNRL